jgi:hypothetical protein
MNANKPHVFMRPFISIDGNQWCALYGKNLQDGVCGFGDTPAEAMSDFDKNWLRQKPRALEDQSANQQLSVGDWIFCNSIEGNQAGHIELVIDASAVRAFLSSRGLTE